MQAEKSQTEGKMDNAGNEVYLVSGIIRWPRVGISWSASETDDSLFFLTFDIKNYHSTYFISFIFDILRRKTTFTKHRWAFFVVVQKWRQKWFYIINILNLTCKCKIQVSYNINNSTIFNQDWLQSKRQEDFQTYTKIKPLWQRGSESLGIQ